jgi:hypothetical protein
VTLVFRTPIRQCLSFSLFWRANLHFLRHALRARSAYPLPMWVGQQERARVGRLILIYFELKKIFIFITGTIPTDKDESSVTDGDNIIRKEFKICEIISEHFQCRLAIFLPVVLEDGHGKHDTKLLVYCQ